MIQKIMLQQIPTIQRFSLIADIIIIGSNSRKSNGRRIVGDSSLKSEYAQQYKELFNKQIERFKNDKMPIDNPNYFWVFEFYYSNKASDVSIELMFDLLERSKVVTNDNVIRNYMCLGEHFDKEFPRTRVRIFGE